MTNEERIEILERKFADLESDKLKGRQSLSSLQEQLRLTDLNNFPFSTFVIDNLKRTLGLDNGVFLEKSGTFTGSTVISDLNGDVDGFYRLIVRTQHSVAHYLYLQFNEDAGTNYIVNHHFFGRNLAAAEHTHYQENSAVNLKITSFQRKEHFADILIYAKSGLQRMVVGQDFAFTDYDNMEGVQAFGLWTNTSDNLTSIKINTGTITSGEYLLYRYA